ncbi:response regulator transcription factor [Sphingobium limneticum]|uniref:Response regulator transcription factor n=2 Tax=Sphingobium TaxID=165695 RepID=A0A5J5HVE0_9SPHN|nr:response regulator transcription factor [Sphingobium limneticum]KAA9011689.1 response regulator transcription factor [Sphingobium limneticum]KAA9013541.1 response regulator transcription factor [Sphingobium limneticum]KAA9026603.1 response regulator transcription factor [Sphingobium limneticum]MBU0930489.1 response regulator transcription factor [Alphaproteobacteria bacterium]
MPSTILIVDDDPHIRQLLVFAFGKAGLETIEAADGEEALTQVERQRPDLVILDINMPRMDGLEVCRRLRAQDDVPIFFLSSRDDEIDRVLGIELGGDDYVVKPFSPREVVARSMAILRRTAAKPPAVENVGIMRHGLLSLDTESWSAHWQRVEVSLTVTEFTILRTLLAMPARIFSRDQIIDRFRGPGFALTDRTVDSHVRNLRRKFADVGGVDLIETRAGIGYRLGGCCGTASPA